MLEEDRTIEVPDTGTTLDFRLWHLRPAAFPIRPVYPGAWLLDARFSDDGEIMLTAGVPPLPAEATSTQQLWRLNPASGQLTPIHPPHTELPPTIFGVAPDGRRVAYVTPASSPPTTITGWSTPSFSTGAEAQQIEPESVWLVALDGSEPAQRIYAMPPANTPAGGPEHVVDLVWTSDPSKLVVVTRQAGPPTRARVVLLDLGADMGGTEPAARELVAVPAEIVPGSEVPDPSGHWLALLTQTASGARGRGVLALSVLELRSDGEFRNIAELGSGTAPVAAPVAWPPALASTTHDQVVYVAPTVAQPSATNSLFAIFAGLNTAPPPTAVFIADLVPSGLENAQPRRLGTSTNHFGVVWRTQKTLLAFGRQADSLLAMHSIDAFSGVAHDLGLRLPVGTAPGDPDLSMRWDVQHGYALLITNSTESSAAGHAAGAGPIHAWLVSFETSGAPSVTSN